MSCYLNTGSDYSDVMDSRRVFQTHKAATGKVRSPMVERRVDGAAVCLCSLSVHSVWTVCTGYEQGPVYFVVTSPNINSVHTCNQFTVVPYHF